MSLPPQAETLINQLLTVMGHQSGSVESMAIHFDKQGLVAAIKPTLVYQRQAETSSGAPRVPAVRLASGRVVNAISLAVIDPRRIPGGPYTITAFAGDEAEYITTLAASGIRHIDAKTVLPTAPIALDTVAK
jgi:hypothetical protein